MFYMYECQSNCVLGSDSDTTRTIPSNFFEFNEFVTNVSYEKNKFFAPTEDNASRELDTLLSVINFGNDEGFAIVSTKDNQ